MIFFTLGTVSLVCPRPVVFDFCYQVSSSCKRSLPLHKVLMATGYLPSAQERALDVTFEDGTRRVGQLRAQYSTSNEISDSWLQLPTFSSPARESYVEKGESISRTTLSGPLQAALLVPIKAYLGRLAGACRECMRSLEEERAHRSRSGSFSRWKRCTVHSYRACMYVTMSIVAYLCCYRL